MKVAVVILIMLGLLAAGAAAVLVQALKIDVGGRQEVPTLDVLVAQSDLPARTRVTVEHVTVEKAPKTGLPQGYFTNATQAIGKTLKVSVVKGQPLVESYFLGKRTVDDMLRPGMLAFQIPLQRRSTAVDLLYPGCTVDVFATFPLTNSDKGEAVVTPLLQNIQVLAVEDETVVPQEQPEKGALATSTPKRQSSMSGNVTVTLEVNSRQAAALQLALTRGTLGLAMRNPLDKNWNPMEPMVVKEGQLTAASEALDPATLALFGSLQRMLVGGTITPDANTAATVAPSDPNAPAPVLPIVAPAPPVPVPGLEPKAPARQVTVIKGAKVEEVEVKEEQGQSSESEPQEGDV